MLRFSNAQQRKIGRVARYVNNVVAHAKQRDRAERGEKDDQGAPIEAPKEEPTLEPDKDDQRRCPTCGLLLPEGSNVCPACMSKTKAVGRMLQYLRPHAREVRPDLDHDGAWAWASASCRCISPGRSPIRSSTRSSIRGVDARLQLLGWLVLILLIVQFLGQALGIWRGRMAVTLGQRCRTSCATTSSRTCSASRSSTSTSARAGALIARVTRDTQALEAVLVESIQLFFSNVFLFVGIGIVLFWMNWRLTLLVFIPAPIVLLLSKFSWDRMMNVWRRAWHLHSRLTATVSDSLAGVRVVRAFAKEDRVIDRFAEHSRELYARRRRRRAHVGDVLPGAVLHHEHRQPDRLVRRRLSGHPAVRRSAPGCCPIGRRSRSACSSRFSAT